MSTLQKLPHHYILFLDWMDVMTAGKSTALSWAGGVISIIGFLSYFLYFARFPSLRDTPWLNTLLIIMGLFISIYGVKSLFAGERTLLATVFAILPLIVGVAALALLLWYSYVLSATMPITQSSPAVGAKAPQFALKNHEGKEVKLSDYLGRRVIMVFYRGFW